MATPQTQAPPKPAAPKPPKPERAPTPPLNLDLYVEVGDAVEYYPGADPTFTPQPGIVSALGCGTIDLSVIHPSLHGLAPQTGVMHMSNPRARTDAGMEGGGWRHRPQTVAVRRMLLAAGIIAWDGNQGYVVAKTPAAEPTPTTPNP